MNLQNNKPQQPKYKFYATLLDAFHYYLNSEYDTAFQEFIDKVNRVPFFSEAADKGTKFNELVDEFAAGRKDEMIYQTLEVVEAVTRKVEVYQYKGYEFKRELVDYFAACYSTAIPQLRTTGYLETSRGWVELYGYIDELEADRVDDIKTTKSYDFPKFLHNYQHIVYPFTLNQQGIPVKTFRYNITDFSNVYIEDYVYNEERDLKRLKSHCEHLISFLETYRHLITDKKVFALDEVEEVANG